MVSLDASNKLKCREVAAELGLVRLDGAPVLDVVLPAVREILQVDTALAYTPALLTNGWEFARYHSVNFANGTKVKNVVTEFLAHAPMRYSWYDAVHPEPSQRNKVMSPLDTIPREEFEASPIYKQWLKPTGLHQHGHLRVLVCEGDNLLLWLGALHPGRFEQHQRRLLKALVPAFRRRMAVERRLAAPIETCTLAAVLEQLAAPAFIVGSSGRVHSANRAALALLGACRSDVHDALRDALAGRAGRLAFTIVPLAERGAPNTWLALLRADSVEAQIGECVAKAAQRWQLTNRQREILRQIVCGQTNAMIAADARTTVRAVELHVTRLLDRAGVDNRASLVTRALLA